MKRVVSTICILIVFTVLSCRKESNYGEAVLRIRGIEEGEDIYIYPIELYDADILGLKPLKKLKVNSENEVHVEKALPGNYFWWDTHIKKGVFQIIENEKLYFDYYIW